MRRGSCAYFGGGAEVGVLRDCETDTPAAGVEENDIVEKIISFARSMGLKVVDVITPPLPWDGGTARTTIQVHAVNRIELG